MRSWAEGMPACRYVEIPGVAHLAPLEAPGPVNSAIQDFLRSFEF
jgi:pimeloyl-ACP methyl ester carboxylesterase